MTQRLFFAFPTEYASKHNWYAECLRETSAKLGCEAVFPTDVVTDAHVLTHVSECIDQCRLGFYDITLLNPNVLIEFGIGFESDRPSFLLLNKAVHVRIEGFFEDKKMPIPLPADLDGIVRLEYTDRDTLEQVITRVIQQKLRKPDREGELMADRIVDLLRARGPLNLSSIADGVSKTIDHVRPILQALVATDRVIREGRSRGSKYRAA